jgi:predicted DNA-binding ribbon-helix-helix protein
MQAVEIESEFELSQNGKSKRENEEKYTEGCTSRKPQVDTNAGRRNSMATSSKLEYFFLQYIPDIVSGESVSIAAVFIDPTDLDHGICRVSLAGNWQSKVRRLDPDADVEMLEAVLTEIRTRLLSSVQRSEMIRELEDSFSNALQISYRRKCPISSTPENIAAFAHEIFDKPSNTARGSSRTRALTCDAQL